ncbi:iron chelate uptake ABC transporter family permease subunit [Microbacterium resistens]|uniref:FecCD family ABC transporter permease n=1 Tax=Microbacterium resistens TaxID=156977 RepID=UPI001C5953D0|nr:iron chelate uptake ABC transporter family permease subunit [Microbacterium resistens]MBW1637812.1 iron chelate uptake ABC transporter family permease subunit [Microbacterium resistens]
MNIGTAIVEPARTPFAVRPSRTASVMLGASLILALSVVLSLAVGARFIPLHEVALALVGAGHENVLHIVGELRVARTVNALICGVALGVARVLMQAITRNPIADPGMLGVNAGASFGVVAGLSVFGALGVGGTVWLALAGAAAASAVIFWFAGSRFAEASPVRLILAGVAFSAILGGATQALVLSDETLLDAFRFWRVGSLTARPVDEALPLVALVVVGALLALALAPALNAMSLGDDSATSLGVRPGVVRALALAAVALLCGTATAIAGPIAFVGLVVPHLVRRAVGPDLRSVLPASVLAAPAMLLLSDTLGRIIGGGGEVQVGIVTAFVGGPLLIAFVARRRGTRLS